MNGYAIKTTILEELGLWPPIHKNEGLLRESLSKNGQYQVVLITADCELIEGRYLLYHLRGLGKAISCLVVKTVKTAEDVKESRKYSTPGI